MPKIAIGTAHISHPTGDTVALENPVLRNLLVQNQPAALDWLKTRLAPVDVSKISIDDQGRVLVADHGFAKAVAAKTASAIAASATPGDVGCSNGAC